MTFMMIFSHTCVFALIVLTPTTLSCSSLPLLFLHSPLCSHHTWTPFTHMPGSGSARARGEERHQMPLELELAGG